MAHSTGSPASRMLTKETPLTTRPARTSRQGMTRSGTAFDAARRARFMQDDARFEQRLADDAAAHVAESRERDDVARLRHAAGGNDLHPCHRAELTVERERRTAQRAVFGYVGDKRFGDRERFDAREDFAHRDVGLARPAVGAHDSVAHVDRRDDTLRTERRDE